MNDIEFETLARTSAAAVRVEAERIADSQSALQMLLAGFDEVGSFPSTESKVTDLEIIDLASARPVRRRAIWLPLTAAAAVVVAVGGVVFLGNGGDDDPAITTDPITVPVTVPAVLPPDSTPEPTNPPNSEPPNTVDAAPVETTEPVDDGEVEPIIEVTEIPDVRGPQLERTVLATYEAGSGDGALGFEQCQECEPFRPWAPIVTDDGTIFVADGLNNRWMIVRDGVWSSVAYREGEVVTAAPVVGPDGLIYAMVADSLQMASPRRVAVYEPETLAEVQSYAVGAATPGSLDVINGNVVYSLESVFVVTDFGTPVSTATAEITYSSNEVEMSISGLSRRFHFPDEWFLEGAAVHAAADGSIVVTTHAPTSDGSLETVLVRLWVDGTVSVGTVGPYGSRANDAIGRYTSGGYVRLEDEIASYAWPAFVGPDPLDGWMIPEFSNPDLDAVPYLVPTAPTPGVVVSERTEYADESSSRKSYLQTWARADDSGAVTGIIQVTTSLDPNLVTAVDTTVVVPGWELAYFNDSTPEVAILRLHTATRSMTVWTSGLDQDTTQQFARSLTADDDGVGWVAPLTSDSDTWTAIAEGWSGGAASRTIKQSVPGQPLMLELWTAAGVPDAIGTPGLIVSPESPITLADVNGRTALVTDRGSNSAVAWQQAPGVIVLLGVDGSPDVALATARSITEVDRAAWLAAAVEDLGDGDGCDGMFC